ncbi:MAG: hypothetical protein WBV62_07655, partial [Roseobacter sp.]
FALNIISTQIRRNAANSCVADLTSLNRRVYKRLYQAHAGNRLILHADLRAVAAIKRFTRHAILETNPHDFDSGIAALVFCTDPAVCGSDLCVAFFIPFRTLVLSSQT